MRQAIFLITVIVLSFCSVDASYAQAGYINLMAGAFSGYSGDGGPATSAGVGTTAGSCTDNFGNFYFCDESNHCIRKVNTAGIISTVAGIGISPGYSGDGGPATAAELNTPFDVKVDALGNLYIADGLINYRIRKVDASGTITTFAGTGTAGYSGDGGPATAAMISSAQAIALDGAGNLYIADYGNSRIRKINTSGVITTIAGTGYPGYTGDSGPATAAEIDGMSGIAADNYDNVYFPDFNNMVVRKINASGVITTIAGTGSTGFSGDGGAATAANLNKPYSVAIDGGGSVYFTDINNYRVRQINTSGVINTIAGTGIAGLSGDGGPATIAQVNDPFGISVDASGNIYVSDITTVRKITSMPTPCTGTPVAGAVVSSASVACAAASVILADTGSSYGSMSYQWQASADSASWTNISGANTSGYSLTGLTAPTYYRCVVTCTSSGLSAPTAGFKINHVPCTIVADSIISYPDTACHGAQYFVSVNGPSPLFRLKTYYGDNTSDSIAFVAAGLMSDAIAVHYYSSPGYYSVKQMLYYNGVPQDSVSFHYEYVYCRVLPVKMFVDLNGDCEQEPSEPYNMIPLLVQVDSNSIPIDTFSVTSGLYYKSYGMPGTVYSFRVIPGGTYASCPVSGVLYDTISAITSYPVKYFGLSCNGTTPFDLTENVTMHCGVHRADGVVLVGNMYCTPENATVTVNFSPQYNFAYSSPAPTTQSGTNITWDLATVSADIASPIIQFTLGIPGAYLSVGDTINSNYLTTPTTGDVNPANNSCARIDTVKAGYDPNYMAVTPSGNIVAGTQLEYTVNFENTGNDTAHNIYVMDTLSDNVDPRSLEMVAASAVMNIAPFNDGVHNIVKFDFPLINLLDSSHHGRCDGTFMFTVKTYNGLPDGTTIFNHAGIFFDDNPVVMTDTVEDVIGTPVNSVGNVQLAPGSLQISPNPTTDQLTIKMDQDAYYMLTITNSVGQEIMQKPLTRSETNINVDMLPAGLYYITFRGNSGTTMRKFVKM